QENRENGLTVDTLVSQAATDSRRGRGGSTISLLICSEVVPADESTSKRQECFVDVSSLFIANAQAARLTKPGEGSFYYPPPSAQSTGVFGVSLGEPRVDPTIS